MNNETLDRRRNFARKACKAAQILETWGWVTGVLTALGALVVGVTIANERDYYGDRSNIGVGIGVILGGLVAAIVVTSIYVMIANYVKAKLAEYVD